MQIHQNNIALSASELGKKTDYDTSYNPDRLFPILRKGNRADIGITERLPFFGYDVWNHYEVSWLDEKGKPVVAMAEITYDCSSPSIIESKSMKLYFNSFNNTQFQDSQTVALTIQEDIEAKISAPVAVKIIPLAQMRNTISLARPIGECIDELDVACSIYSVDPSFLTAGNEIVEEVLYSDLLKSNCLVTQQPDWGSVQISYKGKKINREGLLRYIVSFRNHHEFHEHCIERIFVDIMRCCQPNELTVHGRYTRRGGLDINPYRSTQQSLPAKGRLVRQ